MNNARFTAVSVLEDVIYRGAYSNIALNNKLNNSELNLKDRALVTEIVYGTLKYKYTIDCILSNFLKNGLNNVDKFILNLLRISIYQIIYLDKVPEFAIVNEAVEISKKKSVKLSRLVNGVLRNYLRNKEKTYYNKNSYIDKLCFKYSFPEWMVKLFINQYGKDGAENIIKGLNYTPKVTVRINGLKTNFEETWDKLLEHGYDIEKGNMCEDAIIINRGSNIEKNSLFKEGYISVQDQSAMMAVLSLDLCENMTVFDMCSAPGGKATYIAEKMKDKGHVYAYDIYKNKIKLIEKGAERLGIKIIKAGIQNAEKYNEKFEKSADRVLMDVPCSGLGIIRKKPEIKWNKSMKQLKDIVRIQKNIMMNSSRYVKTGGKMVYSTCTLNREENEENIKWFLENKPDFKLEKINFKHLDNIVYHKEGCVTILPHENMDGFFIAKMIKYR
ncbi:16S rRNA (cytosine967-C5)-methyltransferase [Clostridium algifaecis]|uniref:16S rRNA (cytosine(967)-C(5))-methyltransferase n=1 Tax=Clostridium algifaecis TaxID=1472040 RepID=A0ABS4KNI8_9CLOT|nr:16S rRNA (cytosine(967)-C(5))-methyltransferase RsmB [Clostridium algifaecis]MBP2031607.1 16S rRNA (cytosine967-C5)-methyltransferase [Clostridium algifaecis]